MRRRASVDRSPLGPAFDRARRCDQRRAGRSSVESGFRRIERESPGIVRLSLTFSELGYPTDLVGSRGMLSYRVERSGAAATHAKFAATSVLPEPFHLATLPYGHSGRVRSPAPLVTCDAMILSGACPFSIHCSIAAILSKVSVPGPPAQWPMPGTI